jgi:hypothetical protein
MIANNYWRQELSLVRAIIAKKEKQITEIRAEIDTLHQGAKELYQLEMEAQYGMRKDDQLAITPRFRQLIQERRWGEYQTNGFLDRPSVYLTHISADERTTAIYGGVHTEPLGSGGSGTGNIPLDILQEMRKAWLEQQVQP